MAHSSDHPQRLRMPNVPRLAQRVLAGGGLQVAQVLLQRRLVELAEELRANGGVELTDLVDKLTFVHGILTFADVNLTGSEIVSGPSVRIGKRPAWT